MPRSAVLLVLIALLAGLSLSARGQDEPPKETGAPQTAPKARPPVLDWNLRNFDPDQRQRMLRFSTFANGDVPEEYVNAENTVGYTVGAIARGGELYATQCSECHGDLGLGNGDLAVALTPSPAMLAYLVGQPVAVDQYLLWSVAEGGKRFGTAMPAFKDKLSHKQIFEIVAYLRAGFPDLDDSPVPSRGPGAAETDAPDDRTHDID